ncbi:MAG: hypothetical protein LBV47_01970, partial [Bacteroidales bacterium]|nr:hypothetical protein [Bacteroidales bacterium]
LQQLKRPNYLLQQFHKHKNDDFARCHSVADGKKTKLPLATKWRRLKRQTYSLPQRGKREQGQITPCGVSATTKQTTLPPVSAMQT